MTLHHTKHHQTYVNGLNAAEESLAKFSSEGDVKSQIGLQAALKFNGGGHMYVLPLHCLLPRTSYHANINTVTTL